LTIPATQGAVELHIGETAAGRIEYRAPELRAAIADPDRIARRVDIGIVGQMEGVEIDQLAAVHFDAHVLAIEIGRLGHLRLQRRQLGFQLFDLLAAGGPVAGDAPRLAAGAGA